MARRTGAKIHTHKYRKGDNGIWSCALPDCTHYMPTNVADQIEGKKSICWECGEGFYLTEDSLRMRKPICYNCMESIPSSDSPSSEETKPRSISEFLKGLH